MPSVKARIDALQSILKPGNTDFFDNPPEELDPISQSVLETVRELEALDTPEKKAAYCREHNTTPEEIISIFRQR